MRRSSPVTSDRNESELQEGLHRHERISDLVCDLGAECSERGEAIELANVAIESLDA
jgi:hypothetical protein